MSEEDTKPCNVYSDGISGIVLLVAYCTSPFSPSTRASVSPATRRQDVTWLRLAFHAQNDLADVGVALHPGVGLVGLGPRQDRVDNRA